MVPNSPVDALGVHANGVRDLLVEVVKSRHDRFAEAHQISGSRYGMAFGAQWRDLLEDVREALTERGFQSHKLAPAGYKIPVINDCLVYVWRVSGAVDSVASFASSPTRKNGFLASPPDPMLFDPALLAEPCPVDDSDEETELESIVRVVSDTMPLVLVMVQSSPRQLRLIEWAVAELSHVTGEILLHGQRVIWEPELITADVASDIESFDSGIPVAPAVELQKQEATRPDA
ncbi:hypothetical protein GCM10009569_26940 [Arthrobacter russicus]